MRIWSSGGFSVDLGLYSGVYHTGMVLYGNLSKVPYK